MGRMKSNVTNGLRIFSGFTLVLMMVAGHVRAQQTSPSPKPADTKTQSSTSQNSNGDQVGNYDVISSIEFGYRGITVSGDENKYKSDLNYKAGPRLFDTSFLLKAKEGKGGGLFDTFLVTSTGWGADPYGQMRISAARTTCYWF